MTHFDDLEVRSADERQDAALAAIRSMIGRAKSASPGWSQMLAGLEPDDFASLDDLRRLPVLRKSRIGELQNQNLPFGGLTSLQPCEFEQMFQSPGPIYEPGRTSNDWWRLARFIHACGIGPGDIVQNCLSYHFTPAGMMVENGARAVGAAVFPAGTGQTELQARAAADLGVTAYAGTPDFLKVILDKADELGLSLPKLKKAAVGGGALFPSVREFYANRGIGCLQFYGTAELGNVAYETVPDAGLIVDEGVLVEIVVPGTGDPVEPGGIGEVLVTTLDTDYPLFRFATGDLSSELEGISVCGRTNMRISGWKGRADQTAKVRGMFVRPEQIAEFRKRCREVGRVRVEISRQNDSDQLVVSVETDETDAQVYESRLREVLKLRSRIVLCTIGSLPDDGKVIDDRRSYD